jgi:hypothetical protein
MGQYRTLLTLVAVFAVTLMVFGSWHSSSSSNGGHGVHGTHASSLGTKGVVVVCPAGFIPSTSASAGSTPAICTPCSAGSYCSDKFEKISCPIGSYCPIASSLPISCGDGQTTVGIGSTSEIQCQCTVGSYRTPNTKQPCQGTHRHPPLYLWYYRCIWCCVANNMGGQMTFDGTECPEDTYCPDGVRLYSCESGTHSAAGSKLSHDCTCASGLVLIDGNCIKCEAGSICTHGKMKKCPVNHYCPEGTSKAIVCPDNTISVEGSSQLSNCRCNVGSYPVMDGATNLTTCTSCPSGSYCDGLAVTSCGGHYTSPVGSKSKSDCICDTNSLAVTGADKTIQCVACPHGHKCNGTDKSEGCPANFYCEVGKEGPPTPCPQDRPKAPLGSTELSQCRALADCGMSRPLR